MAALYKIGWVINGNMPGPRSAAPVIRAVTLLDKEEEEDKDEELKADLTRFWQLGEVGTTAANIQIQQKHTICRPAAGKSLGDMWYLSPERTQLLNWDSPDPQPSIVLSGMRGLCKIHHPVYGRPPRPQNLPCQAI